MSDFDLSDRHQYNPIRMYTLKLFAFCPISTCLDGLFVDILVVLTIGLGLYGLWMSHLDSALNNKKHARMLIYIST